jgi:hypothetical protein
MTVKKHAQSVKRSIAAPKRCTYVSPASHHARILLVIYVFASGLMSIPLVQQHVPRAHTVSSRGVKTAIPGSYPGASALD